MSKQVTVEVFLNDVAGHRMKVHRDDGIHRHVSFRAAEDSWNMWFEIVTWPGCLTLHGDMGTWVFQRVEDMFTFFRRSELKVNASYWSEKAVSNDRVRGEPKQFTAEAFKSAVLHHLDNHELAPDKKQAVIEALDDEVFNEEHEYPARDALYKFEHDGFSFQDTWEFGGKEYGYHFLWCLYAIVWGIQQYDAMTAATQVPAEEVLAR